MTETVSINLNNKNKKRTILCDEIIGFFLKQKLIYKSQSNLVKGFDWNIIFLQTAQSNHPPDV